MKMKVEDQKLVREMMILSLYEMEEYWSRKDGILGSALRHRGLRWDLFGKNCDSQTLFNLLDYLTHENIDVVLRKVLKQEIDKLYNEEK